MFTEPAVPRFLLKQCRGTTILLGRRGPDFALFPVGLLGLLDGIHAANHERREIASVDLFLGRLFVAEGLPGNLGSSLLRGFLKFRGYTGNRLVE
jgi:hypothetical protein